MKSLPTKVNDVRVEYVVIAAVFGVFGGTRLQMALGGIPGGNSPHPRTATIEGLSRFPSGFTPGSVSTGSPITGDLTMKGVFVPYCGKRPDNGDNSKARLQSKQAGLSRPANPEGPTFLLVPIRPSYNPFFMTAREAALPHSPSKAEDSHI